MRKQVLLSRIATIDKQLSNISVVKQAVDTEMQESLQVLAHTLVEEQNKLTRAVVALMSMEIA